MSAFDPGDVIHQRVRGCDEVNVARLRGVEPCSGNRNPGWYLVPSRLAPVEIHSIETSPKLVHDRRCDRPPVLHNSVVETKWKNARHTGREGWNRVILMVVAVSHRNPVRAEAAIHA